MGRHSMFYNRITQNDNRKPFGQNSGIFAADDQPASEISTAIAPDASSVVVGFANGDLLLYSLWKKKVLWRKNKAHQGDIQRLA